MRAMRTMVAVMMMTMMIRRCRARMTTDRVGEEGKGLEARSERRG
jgi:hypothetical protein